MRVSEGNSRWKGFTKKFDPHVTREGYFVVQDTSPITIYNGNNARTPHDLTLKSYTGRTKRGKHSTKKLTSTTNMLHPQK